MLECKIQEALSRNPQRILLAVTLSQSHHVGDEVVEAMVGNILGAVLSIDNGQGVVTSVLAAANTIRLANK